MTFTKPLAAAVLAAIIATPAEAYHRHGYGDHRGPVARLSKNAHRNKPSAAEPAPAVTPAPAPMPLLETRTRLIQPMVNGQLKEAWTAPGWAGELHVSPRLLLSGRSVSEY